LGQILSNPQALPWAWLATTQVCLNGPHAIDMSHRQGMANHGPVCSNPGSLIGSNKSVLPPRKGEKHRFFAPRALGKLYVGSSFHWETSEQVTSKTPHHLDFFVVKNARRTKKFVNNMF